MGTNKRSYLFHLVLTAILFHISLGHGLAQAHRIGPLTEQINARPRDTVAVQLLIALDSIYLYNMMDTKDVLDSAVLLASQAKQLSATLNYAQGLEDATYLLANAYAEQKDFDSAIRLKDSSEGILRVRILIMLAERIIFEPGATLAALARAHPYIAEAKELGATTGSVPLWHNSLALMGKYHFLKGESERGKRNFMLIIEECQLVSDKAAEAKWWDNMGEYLPDTSENYSEKVAFHQRAIDLYGEMGLQEELPNVLGKMARTHLLNNHPEEAKLALHRAIAIKKKLGNTRLFAYYRDLSKTYLSKGDHNQALDYGLQALDNAKAIGETHFLGTVRYQLAHVYEGLGELDKALSMYQSALNHLTGEREHYLFPICDKIVGILIQKGQAREALAFLNSFVSKNDPKQILDEEIIAAARGKCHEAMGDHAQAERDYLQMIALDKAVNEAMSKLIFPPQKDAVTGPDAYFTLGQFYLQRQRYHKAQKYLQKALGFEHLPNTLARKKDIELLLFKADSAQGNYLSAMEHFRTHKDLNDFIVNESRNKEIAQLMVTYEAKQKDQDIMNLEKDSKLKNERLMRATYTRNWILAVTVLLVLVIALLVQNSRHRSKATKKLKAKQVEINGQNLSLQQLVKEKERLLKEIHHRVKNNFHMIMGLLGTQAGYLRNNEAKVAIEQSQQRVLTMALLHQKLYQSDSLSTVNIQSYFHELVEYIKDSFIRTQQLCFQLEISPIQLNLSEAVPIGLILNEAVTNAIKYAFIGQKSGLIIITFKYKNPTHLLLTVRDNGIGISPISDVDDPQYASMGMNLMRGLSEELGGTFAIARDQGTILSVEFPYSLGTPKGEIVNFNNLTVQL